MKCGEEPCRDKGTVHMSLQKMEAGGRQGFRRGEG